MPDIINRQTVTISSNLFTANANNNVNLPISLRFSPDEVIVRQLSYATATATNVGLQLYSNLIDDQILAIMGDFNSNNNLENHFLLHNKPQYGTYNFQLQLAPASGVGTGTLAGNAIVGTYTVVLEFIQYHYRFDQKK